MYINSRFSFDSILPFFLFLFEFLFAFISHKVFFNRVRLYFTQGQLKLPSEQVCVAALPPFNSYTFSYYILHDTHIKKKNVIFTLRKKGHIERGDGWCVWYGVCGCVLKRAFV